MDIRIENIQKSFDGNVALQPIQLNFKSEDFTTLLGPSGCGKTTLLRIIAGLEEADEGELYFDDVCVYSKKKQINVLPERRGLAFVFQDLALWPHMTVYENVAFGLRALKKKDGLREKVREALAAVQLSEYEKHYPHQLSGGQQQRVAFARAIVVRPKCILFDEPLSALDALLREEMREELKKLVKERGITAVFVTHDQLEAMSMSDRIVVFEKGRIAQVGSPQEIYENPVSPSVAKFVGHSNWLGEDSMIRPEHMWIDKLPDGDKKIRKYKMKVKNFRFMGNCYEILVGDKMNNWSIMSSKSYALNEEIIVYIDESAIINF